MKMQLNKIKKAHVILGVIVFFIIFGIIKNPDRKVDNLHTELNKVFESSFSNTQNLVNSISQNKQCFNFESLENLNSSECITTIKRNFMQGFPFHDYWKIKLIRLHPIA